MGRHQEVVDVELADRARAELSKHTDARIGMRLQSIVSCASHPLRTVAEIFGVDRRSIWQWAKRFKKEGIDGLRDRARGHRRGRLSTEQQGQVEQWLEHGQDRDGKPVHWTLAKLQAELERVFGVKVSLTAVWKRVRKMGFRQKVPRPRHRRADPEAAQAFKKKSLRSPRPTHRTRTP
jgi:transposase